MHCHKTFYMNLIIIPILYSWYTNNKFIKGALDNFSLVPKFFFKKVEIFTSLEVYTYVVTAC